MKTSVLIAAYNCSRTIQETLDSVFAQTIAPDEVIVLNDGSTDDTLSVVESYKAPILILNQPNKGVSCTRNSLCERATGDLLAFIDSDDIWHPKYLEVQCKLFEDHPDAVGFFTGHVNFHGFGPFDWSGVSADIQCDAEVIDPRNFVRCYNTNTGQFASMSYLSVPKRVFDKLGNQPFCEKVPGVEDSFLCTTLPLLGPVVYYPAPLVAYRVTPGSLSVLRLVRFAMWVEVFEILKGRYEEQSDPELIRAFRKAQASKRRSYAKILMGASEVQLARDQLWRSVGDCQGLPSMSKSVALFLSTHMPRFAQPKWPSRFRE
jgi:glycosyltransferase involved in cell wall biosynthesis